MEKLGSVGEVTLPRFKRTRSTSPQPGLQLLGVNMLAAMNRWLSLPDDFFDDLDDCGAYFAVVKSFHGHIWWNEAFSIPVHKAAIPAAARWAGRYEEQYRESVSTTAHRLVRHAQFEGCMSELLSTTESIVRKRYDVDGTDFSDLDIFDETKFPELVGLAFASLENLLEVALTLNKG